MEFFLAFLKNKRLPYFKKISARSKLKKFRITNVLVNFLSVRPLPSLPYTNQRNAWFDRDITRWWINNLLLPYYDEQHGRGVPCVILLDN